MHGKPWQKIVQLRSKISFIGNNVLRTFFRNLGAAGALSTVSVPYRAKKNGRVKNRTNRGNVRKHQGIIQDNVPKAFSNIPLGTISRVSYQKNLPVPF